MPVSNQPTKVMIIGPNIGMGGVERASCNIANLLHTSGYEIVYLALIQDTRFFTLSTGIKFVEPKGFNAESMSLIKTWRYIRNAAKKIDPDYVFTFTKFYSALANFSLLFTKYRLIISERSSPYYKWPFKINVFAKISFLLRGPLAVVCQTFIAEEVFKRKYGTQAKYFIIPNPVTSLISNDFDRDKTILAVGRFDDPCKGFDRLVAAFDNIGNSEWRLVFAGGNKEDASFMDDIELSEGSMGRMLFLGKVKNLKEQYNSCGIFVIPSRSEGFPNVLLEAMSAGAPCISYDFVAGPRDIITDGQNGVLVKDGDVNALTSAIESLIENRDLRMRLGENAIRSSEKYTPEQIALKYKELFNTLDH